MDNLTHTLFAATLARTRLGRAGRGSTAALIIALNAPDVDALAAAEGTASYLTWHRGPTHGPLGVVVLGAVTASLVWAAYRRCGHAEARPPTASFGALVGLSMLGVLLHILMDLTTPYGTRLFSPFDWHWYAIDWLPILDIYLIVALAAGLLFGLASPRARRLNTALVLVLMAANYGMRGLAHHSALTLAPRLFGPTLPQRCDPQATEPLLGRWPRLGATTGVGGRRCLIEIAAIPSFVSPFQWRIVAHLSNAYEVHAVDLLDARFSSPPSGSEALWRRGLRYPNQWTAPVAQAAATPAAQAFLGFSRFPAVVAVVDQRGMATVRWTDMRFAGGILTPQAPEGRQGFFSVLVRIGADGAILGAQFGP